MHSGGLPAHTFTNRTPQPRAGEGAPALLAQATALNSLMSYLHTLSAFLPCPPSGCQAYLHSLAAMFDRWSVVVLVTNLKGTLWLRR